jgi:pimeloyl-ACP methyl ester carboxylesterase
MIASACSTSSNKSTNARALTIGALRQSLMPLLGRVLPGLAATVLERAMLTPTRPRDRAGADLVRRDTATLVPYGHRWLATWSFGAGPTVMLVHGWSGHAGQFEPWIEALVAAGYRVVLFDAPAHGLSTGTRTTLMDFAGAVQHVAGLSGPIHAIVAHSFGAPAAVFAMKHGLAVRRLVLLAAPISLIDAATGVARLIGFPLRVARLMQRRLERRLKFRWAETTTDRFLAQISARGAPRTLLIHDRRDREVPFAMAERIAAAVPSARLVATDGLGHVRLLRARRVVDEALNFLRADAR